MTATLYKVEIVLLQIEIVIDTSYFYFIFNERNKIYHIQ